MSRLIEDQGHYLQLLQSTSKLQRKAMLTTITKPQLKALKKKKNIEEIQENINPGASLWTR